MAEGDFPKSDGDVLYASEVNYDLRPLNLSAGKTPTASGTFAVSPTSLTNVTDEDLTTGTNTFEVATGNSGYIQVDEGRIKTHSMIGYKWDTTTTDSGNRSRGVQVSEDASSWTTVINVNSTGAGTSNLDDVQLLKVNELKFRYIRFYLTANTGTNNITGKLYELYSV